MGLPPRPYTHVGKQLSIYLVMMDLRNAKVAKNDEQVTVFPFSKFLVSGRGNASKDGVTRGVTRGVTT